MLRFNILLLMGSSTPNDVWYSSYTRLLILYMDLQLLVEAGCSWVLRRWGILPEDVLLTWSDDCFRGLMSLLFNYWIGDYSTFIINYTFRCVTSSTIWPRWHSLNLMKWVLSSIIIICTDTCRCHL